MALPLTIEDLKKHLGPGLGLRSNKYLIEIPVPGNKSRLLNVLCQSVSLPERTIKTVELYNKGRKYVLRGETEFPGTYTISVLDNSKMEIRELFDRWLDLVDQTLPRNNGILGNISQNTNTILDTVSGIIKAGNKIKTTIQNDYGTSFLINAFNQTPNHPNYMCDINVWQLDARGNKVYGYTLQNAFPSSLGALTLSDEEENQLSKFDVIFSYSESMPTKGIKNNLIKGVIGSTGNDILDGAADLFSL